MCDSFPAISAEQLTKAVNLAAAGTLSALDAAEDENSHSSSRRDAAKRKGCVETHTIKDESTSKSSLHLLECLSESVLPQPPRIEAEVTPSTTFYGRATRKVSKKKESPVATGGRKYSSRKNYKLSPPLLTSGVRTAVRNASPQILLDSHVLKIRNVTNDKFPPAQTHLGKNQPISIRPVTFIHSPQLPPYLIKDPPCPSTSFTNVISSSASVVNSPMKILNDGFEKNSTQNSTPSTLDEGVSTSSKLIEPSAESKSVTPQFDLMIKGPVLSPQTKPDPVFRVPLPVSVNQPQSATVNAFQVVRLPVGGNSRNVNVSSMISPSRPLFVVSSSEALGQSVMNKAEKSKSTILAPISPQMHSSAKMSTFSPSNSTLPSKAIPSHEEILSSGLSQNGADMSCGSVVVVKTLPSSQINSSSTITSTKTPVSGFLNVGTVISMPSSVAITKPSLVYQLATVKPQTVRPVSVQSANSSQTPINTTSKYVNIRPNLKMLKDTRLPLVLTPNLHLRPVYVVTSTSSPTLSVQTTKTQSTTATVHSSSRSSNSGVVLFSSLTSSKNTSLDTTITPASSQLGKFQPESIQMHTSNVNTTSTIKKPACHEKPFYTTHQDRKTASSIPVVLQTAESVGLFRAPHQLGSQFSPSNSHDCNLSTVTPPLNQSISSSITSLALANTPTRVSATSLVTANQPTTGCLSLSSPPSFASSLSVTALQTSISRTSSITATSQPVTGFSLDSASVNLPTATSLSSIRHVGPRPQVVAKDSSSQKIAQQGSVRLTVYPLTSGLNPVSTGCRTKSPTVFSSVVGQVLNKSSSISHSQISGNSSQTLSASSIIVDRKNTLLTQSNSASTVTASKLTVPCRSTPLNSSTASVKTIGTTPGILNGTQSVVKSQSSTGNPPKLVISPSGIQHLQSLLRQMGTSEGYFLISTPRSQQANSQQVSSPYSVHKIGITNTSSLPIVVSKALTDASTLKSWSTLGNDSSSSSLPPSLTSSISMASQSPALASFLPGVNNPESFKSTSSSPNKYREVGTVAALGDRSASSEVESIEKMDEDNSSVSVEPMNGIETEVRGEEDSDEEDDNEEEDDDDEDDGSSSAGSSCSSNALVIETNDHTDDSVSSSVPEKELDSFSKDASSLSKEELADNNISKPDAVTSPPASYEKVSEDLRDNPNLASAVCPETNLSSPLSLGEIVRQHQYKNGVEYQSLYSPPFASCKELVISSPEKGSRQCSKGDTAISNMENFEIRFPVPESPLFSCLSRLNHQQNENQTVSEHNLNSFHSFHSQDLLSDIHMHNQSDIEAAMNLQRLSECPPAPLPPVSSSVVPNAANSSSIPGNAGSPKSPLSINSSQPIEPHTPLHPPMTPNTVLINLLNRVPTPLLTNHQDLLSVPSSQDNHFHVSHQESSENKQMQVIHEKSINGDNSEISPKEVDPCNDEIYNSTTNNVVLRDSSQSFGHPQNALDLIASNYLPAARKEIRNTLNDQIPPFSSSEAPSQNLPSFSRSWQQQEFTPCSDASLTYATQEYHMTSFTDHATGSVGMNQCLGKTDCDKHCKSCAVPITITVNLDSDFVSLSNGMGDESQESNNHNLTISADQHQVEPQFQNHQHNLPQQQQCVLFDGFPAANPVTEKSCDAEIIRHLIMNTGNNSNHHQQQHHHNHHHHHHLFTETQSDLSFDNCNQPVQNCPFGQRHEDSFLPSNEASSNAHCDVSESNSQFTSHSFDERISMARSLTQETCHQNFNNMYENNSAFETVEMNVGEGMENCSFNCSSTSLATYGTSSSAVFDSPHNAIFTNPQDSNNSSFLMPNSLPDMPRSFDTNAHCEKDSIIIHQGHNIQSDGKHSQSSEYTSDLTHNDLFFHQSPTSESHSSDLHLYDMNSLHDSTQELSYSLSAMGNHNNPLKSHPDCLPSSHCSDLQTDLLGNQCDLQGQGKQLQDHAFDFSMDQNHQFPADTIASGNSDSGVPFSSHQPELGFINDQFSSQFYTNATGSNLPIFSQHCAVGSEAPLMESNNPALHCPLPSASGLQLEFPYQPQGAAEVGEKHPVLPSASFSPPSVADPAVTPDPGAMEMYNGSFQNLSAYDSYLRGSHPEGRAPIGEESPASGNFCVECNTMYKNQCKFHPFDCQDVSDTPILSHARLTLPTCLKLGPSAITGHTNNTGVFAKETIAVRTKFGPLIGSPVSCDQLGSTRSFSLWQTFMGSNVKVIDTSDENSSNWMMFVKPARVSSEHNLVAFQHGNQVFFVTRTVVTDGQELLYWFSKDYSRMLGISSKPKNAQHQLCPHCPQCKHVFADRKQVRSHIRIQHPKPQVNKCSHCSKSFSQLSHLNAHVLAVHLRIKKFECPHCGKRFGDSSNLRKHIKSHSDERKFKCQICSKAFRQKAHLQVHMNSHMPVKHEQCRFCGNRFTRAFERKQHELQHTKQNRIECQLCTKVFYKQKIYKEHLKIHRNERNFPCSHCGKAFLNKFALTRHGPACKQRKQGLSLITADTRTNILSRQSVTTSSALSDPIIGNPTGFTDGKEDDSSLHSSSASSSSGFSSSV